MPFIPSTTFVDFKTQCNTVLGKELPQRSCSPYTSSVVNRTMTPKMFTSQFLQPVNMVPNVAKGTLHL